MAEDFLSGLMDALFTGAKHTYGQVSDDVSSLFGGQINPGTLGRVGEVAGGLPLEKLIGPLQQAGTAAKNIIAPTAQPMLQNLLKALGERAPRLVGQAQNLAQTVRPYLVPRESMPVEGALGAYRSSRTMPTGELYVRGGRPQGEQIDTLGHELKHFITSFDPRVAKMRPEHMLETSQQLSHMMPPAQRTAMQNYLPSASSVPAIMEGVRMKGPAQPGSSIHTAYDEALSYLTEALMQGAPDADPAFKAIANALGHGIR